MKLDQIYNLLRSTFVTKGESNNFNRIQYFFNAALLIVMFWLPVQWYLQNQNKLSHQFINNINWIIWIIFLLEVLILTYISQHKLRTLQANWLNIAIIIMIFPPLWTHHNTYFALLRYLRFIVLFKLIVPQFYNLHRILLRNKFGFTLLAFIIVTILSGIIAAFVDPSIGSIGNGIWWAWQTVTTVGYGNIVPHSTSGRIYAALLMILGVGLFSLVSANLSAYFIERGQAQQKKKSERQLLKELQELNHRLNRIEELLVLERKNNIEKD